MHRSRHTGHTHSAAGAGAGRTVHCERYRGGLSGKEGLAWAGAMCWARPAGCGSVGAMRLAGEQMPRELREGVYHAKLREHLREVLSECKLREHSVHILLLREGVSLLAASHHQGLRAALTHLAAVAATNLGWLHLLSFSHTALPKHQPPPTQHQSATYSTRECSTAAAAATDLGWPSPPPRSPRTSCTGSRHRTRPAGGSNQGNDTKYELCAWLLSTR